MGNTVTSAFQMGTHFPFFWEHLHPPYVAPEKTEFLTNRCTLGVLCCIIYAPPLLSEASVLLLLLKPGLGLFHRILIWSQTPRPLPASP